MKSTLILLIAYIISPHLIAQHKDICCEVIHHSNKAEYILKFLESSNMQFQDSIIENNVDGIQKIGYYLCKENHSYLFVEFEDKKKLYKNVPLEVWFELKYHESKEYYYKSQIKYDFVPV